MHTQNIKIDQIGMSAKALSHPGHLTAQGLSEANWIRRTSAAALTEPVYIELESEMILL